MKITPALCFVLVVLASASAEPLKLSADKKGILIDAGGVERFALEPPVVRMAKDDYTGQKPNVTVEGDVVMASYPSGAEVRLEVSDADQSVSVSFFDLPAEAYALNFRMTFPIALNKGGRMSLNGAPLEEIPEEHKGQFVTQGNAKQFTLADPMNVGFSMRMPSGWVDFADNRSFNWPVYMFSYLYVFDTNPGKAFVIQFEPLDQEVLSE